MNNLKRAFVSIISLAIVFASGSVFAEEEPELIVSVSEEYINWENLSEEEKKDKLMPNISTVDISENLTRDLNAKEMGLREQVLTGNFVQNSKNALVGANTYIGDRYDLNQNIDVEVKHQGGTNECWAFSTTSMLETNLALTQNVIKKFSVRHMDYSLIRTFSDGINPYGLNREVGIGGLAHLGLAYLTNGKGAVLDSYMPFENNMDVISLEQLNKPVDTIVTDYTSFPSLYKEYQTNGSVIYTNGGSGTSRKVYSSQEVAEVRRSIKEHIVNYGAVTAVTAGNELAFYDKPNDISHSVAYFCNDNSKGRDHAITIVGWDDNYSRDNFTGIAKPSSNGAYICLNSYGRQNFNNGYLYVSYEDSLIESYLYGIKSAKTKDYDNIYQYNYFGENLTVKLNNVNKGYIAEIFSRDTSKNESLKYVGVNIPSSMSLKIYVNENGTNPSLDSCRLVATTGTLSSGYHRIPVEETRLTGDNFTVVIEGDTNQNKFEFNMELAFSGTIYSTVTGNPGKSLYSTNAINWNILSQQSLGNYNMSSSDLTIKAFTVNTSATVPVSSISLDKSEVSLRVGQTQNLVATVLPNNATNKNIRWSSNNESIATVNNGLVTAIAEGSVGIVVTSEDGNKTATCIVTVTSSEPDPTPPANVPVTNITLNKSTLSLRIGQTDTLSATVLPNNATNKNVRWESNKTNIATVNSSGLVTAVAAGETTITATTEDGGKVARCTVTVTNEQPQIVHVNSVSLNKSQVTLNIGQTETLLATISPSTATNKNITWSSSASNIATVSETGIVTASHTGTAIITVTTEDGGKTATCTVTVNAQNPATEINVTSTNYDIKGTDIYKIVHDTTISSFKQNITTNSTSIEIYDYNNNKIENDTELVKSGMRIKLSNGESYTLLVRGDLNSDGKISLTDLSKLIAHYGDEAKYGLTGFNLKAADMNCDGRVSLTDISQLVDLFGHL